MLLKLYITSLLHAGRQANNIVGRQTFSQISTAFSHINLAVTNTDSPAARWGYFFAIVAQGDHHEIQQE